MKRYLFVLVAAVSLSCARNTINYSDVISEMYSCHDTAQWTTPELFDALLEPTIGGMFKRGDGEDLMRVNRTIWAGL